MARMGCRGCEPRTVRVASSDRPHAMTHAESSAMPCSFVPARVAATVFPRTTSSTRVAAGARRRGLLPHPSRRSIARACLPARPRARGSCAPSRGRTPCACRSAAHAMSAGSAHPLARPPKDARIRALVPLCCPGVARLLDVCPLRKCEFSGIVRRVAGGRTGIPRRLDHEPRSNTSRTAVGHGQRSAARVWSRRHDPRHGATGGGATPRACSGTGARSWSRFSERCALRSPFSALTCVRAQARAREAACAGPGHAPQRRARV